MEKSASKAREGRVLAVCISEEKGTRKHPVAQIELRCGQGVLGDAHAGSERQVSLLCEDSIAKMKRLGLEVGPGDFAENITVSGLELHSLPVGAVLKIGEEVRLRISQIGKECHSACEIRALTGACIMPEEGVFAAVIKEGNVRGGDKVIVELV